MYDDDYDPYKDIQENEYINNEFLKELNEFEYGNPFYNTVNNNFDGDQFFYEPNNKEEKMNIHINNIFPFNEEIQEKKYATEVNKENSPTGPSTKFKEGLIFEISKNFDKKIMVGRKKKNNLNGKHDKFAYDNVTRKVKAKLFESILSILNSSTEIEPIENPKKTSKKKDTVKPFFFKIDQKIIKETKVEDNQLLFKSQLKEIFSNDVSKKFENYGLDYNRKLIEKIYKEKKQIKTIQILERNFLECLEHFRGSKFYNELAGLEKEYDKVINDLRAKGETEEYIEVFTELVGRFEEYYENKKARPKKLMMNEE